MLTINKTDNKITMINYKPASYSNTKDTKKSYHSALNFFQ